MMLSTAMMVMMEYRQHQLQQLQQQVDTSATALTLAVALAAAARLPAEDRTLTAAGQPTRSLLRDGCLVQHGACLLAHPAAGLELRQLLLASGSLTRPFRRPAAPAAAAALTAACGRHARRLLRCGSASSGLRRGRVAPSAVVAAALVPVHLAAQLQSAA